MAYEKKILDEAAIKREAELREKEAKEEGIEEVAWKMIQKGYDMEEIMELTGLTKNQVKRLEEEKIDD